MGLQGIATFDPIEHYGVSIGIFIVVFLNNSGND